LWTWLWRDVVYRSVFGVAFGLSLGWLLGKILFDWPSGNALAKTESAVVAFAGVLLVYGATELAEGYGFIAVFVMGLTLRRSESRHEFHTKLHDFSQSIEHMLTSLILVALGAAIPSLIPHLTIAGFAIGLGLIFFVRPLSGWVALSGIMARGRERAVVAFYGIRGIGSVYYVAYATSHIEMVDKGALWATIVFTILLSTVVHGFTASFAVEQATGKNPEAQN
jgi:sodium/hydrogen antiporter